MRYEEFPAPRESARVIECIWILTPNASGGEGFDRVYPDGATDIVVSAGNAAAHGPAPSFRWISSNVPVVGFRIRRGAARTVLGMSPTELAAGPVSIEALWGRRGRELEERLAESCASTAQVASLGGLVAELVAGTGELDNAVLAAIDRVGHPRSTAMKDLAGEVGVSERQLRRRFENQVGLGIKHYARMMRFQRLLDTIRQSKRSLGATSPGWAGLACDHGFADQAHLIREVKAFSGLTPAELWLTV